MLLKNLDTENGLVNGARGMVIGFEKSLGKSNYYPYLPIVKFQTIVGGVKKEEIATIKDDTWDIKQGDKVLASRIQIPLILAWAISIHKAQGMTIPLLEVSFQRMFEYGQAYVALSRATSLEGLTLKSFNPNVVKAHPKVIDFYSVLSEKRKASTGEDQICETTLSELTRGFRDLSLPQYDSEQWLESRNKVSVKAVNDEDNDDDEWLERKMTKKPLQPSSNNSIKESQAQVSVNRKQQQPEPKKKNDEESIVVVSYKPKPLDLIDITQEDSMNSSSPPREVLNTTIYGDVDKKNNPSLDALSVNEELKKKIEANRLAALKKLELIK